MGSLSRATWRTLPHNYMLGALTTAGRQMCPFGNLSNTASPGLTTRSRQRRYLRIQNGLPLGSIGALGALIVLLNEPMWMARPSLSTGAALPASCNSQINVFDPHPRSRPPTRASRDCGYASQRDHAGAGRAEHQIEGLGREVDQEPYLCTAPRVGWTARSTKGFVQRHASPLPRSVRLTFPVSKRFLCSCVQSSGCVFFIQQSPDRTSARDGAQQPLRTSGFSNFNVFE